MKAYSAAVGIIKVEIFPINNFKSKKIKKMNSAIFALKTIIQTKYYFMNLCLICGLEISSKYYNHNQNNNPLLKSKTLAKLKLLGS